LRTDTQEPVDTPPHKALRAKASRAYAQQSRRTIEDQWIVDHLPLVRHVVQKVVGTLGRARDEDDLISAGTVGLVKAARAYDASKHAEFKTYAYIRIRGAVIDELRNRSWVSANVHRLVRKIRRAYERLLAAHGRVPTDEQLAAQAGVPLDKYYRTLEEARCQHFLSIHGLSDDGPSLGCLVPADTTPTPESEAQRREMVDRLTRAIHELPERERKLLILYYDRDLTMKEVAEVLEITESRVSQVHASALMKLSLRLRSAP
jgi:RNA polymerase sigma factor for flagellar operon FliA